LVKFGVSSWVWVYPFSPTVIERAERAGFDGIEIPVEDPVKMPVKETIQALKSSKIDCSSICAVMSPERDMKSPDAKVRQNAKRYVMRCVDYAAEFGCDIVSGPIYSMVGPTLESPEKGKEWKLAVEGVKEVGRYAEEKGIYLGIEPINRYENHLINTVDEALKFIRDVDSPAVKAHVDTYHANIEEKSIGGALRECGSLLYHVHACENDRGTPGSGHIEWKEVADALKSIWYSRYLVIETFQPGVKEIAVAASIWRPLAKSQDDLASEGLRFLKGLMR